MAQAPSGRKATGPIAAAFADEPWLYSYDLPDDRDVTVKIEEVRHFERLDLAGTKHRNVYGLKFVGKKKILLLTAKATFKAVAKLHGKMFDGWVGKEITLYVDEVDAFGQTVDAIRIRTPKGNRGQASAAAREFLDHGDPGPGAPPPGFDPAATGAEDSGATTPAPGPGPADLSDEQAFSAFTRLAHRVSDSFGGERQFLKEAPKGSGAIWTCDPELADPAVQVYLGTEKRLTVTRERLDELTAKLEGMLG